MRTLTRLLAVFILALFLSPCPDAVAQEPILDQDTRAMKLVGPESGVEVDIAEPVGDEGADGQPEPDRPKKRRITRIELVQVIPLLRNNPFNPIEPINNDGGRVFIGGQGQGQVADAGDQVDDGDDQGDQDDGGGVVGPQILGCTTPSFANYQNVFQTVFEVTLLIDPNTEGCRLRSGFSQDPSPDFVALIIDVNFEPLNQPTAVQAGPLVQDFGGGFQQGVTFFPLDETPKSVTVQHIATGKRFRITFVTDTLNTGGVTVTSIIRQ